MVAQGVSLDTLSAAGVSGYLVQTQHLAGPVSDSMVGEWQMLTARGQSLYVGLYATNLYDTRCPFADVWDDGAWSLVRTRLSALGAAARNGGAAGLAIDLEPYTGASAGSRTPNMWNVTFPGNTHDAASTRAKMRQRAAEIAPILASVGEVLIYPSSNASFPGAYQDLVQVNAGRPNVYADNLFPDFLAGLVDGGARVTLTDPAFMSGPQLPGRTWDSGIRESVALTMQAYPTVNASAMLWPDNDESHGPFSVSETQAAFRAAAQYSTGPVVLYQHHLTDGSTSYSAWLSAIAAALSG
jgi:hypothetical protein